RKAKDRAPKSKSGSFPTFRGPENGTKLPLFALRRITLNIQKEDISLHISLSVASPISDLRFPLEPCIYAASGSIREGGWGRNRTGDTRIFSPLLYQLSYPAIYGAILA